MNRYRITVLVVCAVLLALAVGDFYVLHRNPEPQVIAWDVTSGGIRPEREWVTLTGGTLLLEEAVSNSGTLEIDALVIPLVREVKEKTFHILVETRDPQLVEAFATYHLGLNSEAKKAKYLADNIDIFRMKKTINGMVVTGAFGGLLPNHDQEIMHKLAKSLGMDLDAEAIFIHEDKEPASPLRAAFFLIVAIAGILKVILTWNRTATQAA